jgi:thiamine pyrophosphate-dependent acetolactate synthase large subunit-like protein
MTFTAGYLRVGRPERFAFPVEAGSIGVAVGEGIGAAFALPGVVTIVGIGDGGLMMSLSEIETAVRYKVPMVIIVCNDAALGSEVHLLDVAGIPSVLATHSTPSFAAAATALGAEGYTFASSADLAVLEERFKRSVDGPIVIDCIVNPKVRGEWVATLYHGLTENGPTSENFVIDEVYDELRP